MHAKWVSVALQDSSLLWFVSSLQGYFETLRMELADKNISILSVCPGPVDTPFTRNLFSEKISSVAKGPGTTGTDRVSAERCAQLVAITMANKLYEVWISKHPILLFVYLYQYFPNLSSWWVGYSQLAVIHFVTWHLAI